LIAFSLPPLRLEIADGDITAQRTDAIVNAANNALWMGAGVAGAIKARGGVEIERAAMALGPIEPGECVVTTAGRLAATHVIHAAVMGQDLVTSATLIARATRNALTMADDRGCATIALPAFGTGVGGFPVAECARIMIGAIQDHASVVGSLRLVRLILFGNASYCSAAEVAGAMLGTPLDGPPDCPVSA
jgi:O-acetyl-ADP-ribose deacetylase (regulator of RNase III)